MSGDEKNFLSRWSQRKQEAKQVEPDPPAGPAEAPPEPTAVTEADAEPEFDLASLPKLDELTANTDITAFLRKGVPESLRNAALRKSWALDPAIRNYVNPALEYAYDWNTPGGVPGSSEIGAGMDVARMVLQIMGGGETAAEPPPAADPANQPMSDPAPSPVAVAIHDAPDLPTKPLRLGNEGMSVAEASKSEPKPADIASVAPQQTVRRHGSAKPID